MLKCPTKFKDTKAIVSNLAINSKSVHLMLEVLCLSLSKTPQNLFIKKTVKAVVNNCLTFCDVIFALVISLCTSLSLLFSFIPNKNSANFTCSVLHYHSGNEKLFRHNN